MSSKQGRTSTAPKFSSFKPKVEKTAQKQTDKTDDEPKEHSERSVSQKRDRHHSVADESHLSDRTRPRKSSERPTLQEHDGNGIFVHDKRGDLLIRRYGGNDRRAIPNYRRFGSGRVLGTDGYMRIDRNGNRDEFFLLGHGEGRSLLSSDRKSLLARGVYYKSHPVRVRQEQPQKASEEEDFVPLKPSRKRKRGGSKSENSSDEEEQSYRSIHGKSKNHEHSDSDVDYASDAFTGPGERDIDDPVTSKSVELSRRVRDHPTDIDAWFELVDHQDILLRTNGHDGNHPTAAEIKSFADIKLSMLEQAYSHATTDSQREKLQLKIMKEGSKIWDIKANSKRWEDALEKHGTSFELWKEYMNFQQTKLSAFQYEKVKQLYVEKRRCLESEVFKEQSHTNRLWLCERIIYIFLRTTRFISDAGYRELATAAWQAALELTFAHPSNIQNQTEPSIPPSFQDFWESEVPRIGEDSAQGWAAFERDSGMFEPPEPRGPDKFTPPTTRDGYKAWSIVEQHRALAATNPARTMDDGTEDDPFRVVMFADIQDLLLYLPTVAISGVRGQLLDAFLIFCQLPPALSPYDIIQDMLQDDFLVRSPAKIITETSSDSAMEPEEQSKKPPEFSHDYPQINMAPEVLFPLPNWFKAMKNIRDDFTAGQYQWISTTLKQLTCVFGVREMAPYYLAFESVNEPGNEKKTAKALLKQDSTNVNLYMGYAILEWTKGNKVIARNTIGAAMGLTSISTHSKISLGVTAAWMEIEDCNLAKGSLQLCALSDDNPSVAMTPEGQPASTFQILKTRQFLSSNRDYLLSSGDAENAIIYAEGLALLEYLTRRSNKEPSSGSQGDIWSAISTISTCSDELVTRSLGGSSSHERLLQSAARLLYYHANQGPFRPGFLREQLTKFIHFFPRNTIFLTLFAWRETRLSIDDRVRSILDNVVLTLPHDCISSRIFAIRHESRVGNSHSTRAAFERALESEVCGHHPGLWVEYIRFCYNSTLDLHTNPESKTKSKSKDKVKEKAREKAKTKAKEIFYRALQRCPWSKDIFMEAFVTLVRDLDSAELRSVYSTLCEKGLRVHVEMEEFVEGWRKEVKERERGGVRDRGRV
ncbi:DUF1740-domain-containing protein [Hypoxylon trugodes]|uniref:DUF1740-domain-containing protein n=1 Tax=Hypoxylon trugodes TaxID=326681 RepID=UPI00219B9326|nr:DUF1740-domain-containing protein [Hypoxylon trugodes]KAI1384675.1 DUF1740-domain-containing protein [Hypoxylon trugodes]